jgi:hypothetical protein
MYCFLVKMFKICFEFTKDVLNWPKQHEYHFSTYFILLVESLVLQI